MSKTITIIDSKPRISLAYLFISITSVLFCKKGNLVFRNRYFRRIGLFSWGGSLLSGVYNTGEILSLLSGGRYFRNFTVVSYRTTLAVLLR